MIKSIKKAFTLIEMLIVVVVLGIVFTIVIQSYMQLTKAKTDIYIRSVLAKNTNNLVEKLNLIMKNYTIDYEEYFNRKMVGCNSAGGDNFTWDVGTSGYCSRFTTYGNGNNGIPNANIDTSLNVLYYCSSKDNNGLIEKVGGTDDCEGNHGDGTNGITGSNYIYNFNNVLNGSGCAQNGIQSFGEYKVQFWDIKGNSDGLWGCKGDDDDTDLGKGPIAILGNTGVKELYLISKDKKKRIFFRRKLIFSGDLNGDGQVKNWEKLYKIQILKLRGFDAGSGHDFTGPFAYDGKIDTWACDKAEGFTCTGDPVGGGYVGYNLPEDENDGWQDFNITDLSIENLNFTIYPVKDPFYAWQEDNMQISPYVTLDLTTRFYGKNYMRKINPDTLSGYKMHINTTFSIKEY